jgi:hypothetical protein
MRFQKYIGIAYSGSGTPLTRTPSLQVYIPTPDRLPQRVNPPDSDFGSSLFVFLQDAVNEIKRHLRWLVPGLAQSGIDRPVVFPPGWISFR